GHRRFGAARGGHARRAGTGAGNARARTLTGQAGAPIGAGMSGTRKIAFQGELGANSHIACHEAYPDYEPAPCATFEDAFAAITSGQADLAMIPIENSLAGRV